MKIKIDPEATKDFTYDDWMEFFRTVHPADLVESRKELFENLTTEGYAAAARWMEITQSPSKMDKLHSARLKAKNDAKLMDIAVEDDDEAFYEALIKENVQQLNGSNVSAQEAARLTQNINIFRKELREIRSRKPKKGTVLEKVLEKAAMPPKPAKKVAKKSKTTKKTTKSTTEKKQAKNKASKTASKVPETKKTGKASSGKEKYE